MGYFFKINSKYNTSFTYVYVKNLKIVVTKGSRPEYLNSFFEERKNYGLLKRGFLDLKIAT